MADDITVSKEYFLALLRGAELADQQYATSTVPVSIDEYKKLHKAVTEYDALVRALVNAGTPLDSIKVLINAALGVPTPPEDQEVDDFHDYAEGLTATSPDYWKKSTKRIWSKKAAPSYLNSRLQTQWRPEYAEPLTPTTEDSQDVATSSDYESVDEEVDEPKQHFKTCREDRSVVLSGLPKNTSLADISKAVRGGQVLNIFLKKQENTAHVAFVDPDAAETFIFHAKRYDVYIRDKRVDACWDDRQHYMTGAISRRIFLDGATRNIVIRFPKPSVTEQVIRDDLEHIHTLQVVSIHLSNGSAWISLNGVTQATSARHCMMSRLRYKGSRIEFWPDECAEAFQPRYCKTTLPTKPVQKAKVSPISNRYDMLLDEDDSSTK